MTWPFGTAGLLGLWKIGHGYYQDESPQTSSAGGNSSASAATAETRWSKERAAQWYQHLGEIRGVNYIPRTAVNTIEMWQQETFDPKTIGEELNWARDLGLNSLRVFLHFLVWEADPGGHAKRLDQFLELAHRRGFRSMLVLFDDCWNQEPRLGPQEPPVPGVHNSRWVASPGRTCVLDRRCWVRLERYVLDVLRGFGRDERVLMWDLYNEPGNSGLGHQSLPLVQEAFQWARTVGPQQPLTVGLWANFSDPMHRRFEELSDIMSFHYYGPPGEAENRIEFLKQFDRPILCTEFLRRSVGNTFAALLPIFRRHAVGWYHWGLVAGRTQTFYDWSSKPGDPPPRIWQHDLLREDGSPFDPEEARFLKRFAAAG